MMFRIFYNRVLLLSAFSFFSTVIYFLTFASQKNEDIIYDDYNKLYVVNPKFRIVHKSLDEPPKYAVPFTRIDENVYAFSAYSDARDGNMGYKYVRILMMISVISDFTCKINGLLSEKVFLYEFSENHEMEWQVYTLNCKLPDGIALHNIHSIEVSRNFNGEYIPIPIEYHIQDEQTMTPNEYEKEMSICVPALFGNEYDARRIIEFVELNILQGVDRIFVYYDPKEITDIATLEVLKYYSRKLIIILIELSFPFANDKIWYHGQAASIADCLLRNTGISKYTFFNDYDEFFVPVLDNQTTLLQTVSHLFKDPTIGSVRTAVKHISTQNTEPPITLKNIVSTKRFETRFTKCIVRPEMVFEQGIHHTSRVIQDNYQAVFHNGSLLRVYHYKELHYCCEDENLLKKRHEYALQKKFNSVVELLDV